jgi:hypothetical protein
MPTKLSQVDLMDVFITGLETPSLKSIRTTRDQFTLLLVELILKLEERLYLLVVMTRHSLYISLMARFQRYSKLLLTLLQDQLIFLMVKF